MVSLAKPQLSLRMLASLMIPRAMVSASRSWNIPKDQTISHRLHLGDPLLLSKKKKRLDMSLILKYPLFIFLLVIKGFIGAPVFKKKCIEIQL